MKEYIVCFIRADGKPNEEYYYATLEEAQAHYNLFFDDDSELYKAIQITDYTGSLIAEMP